MEPYWQIPLFPSFCVIFTIICCISLAVPTIIIYTVTQKLLSTITVEKGIVSRELSVALLYAIFIGLAIVFAFVLNSVRQVNKLTELRLKLAET